MCTLTRTLPIYNVYILQQSRKGMSEPDWKSRSFKYTVNLIISMSLDFTKTLIQTIQYMIVSCPPAAFKNQIESHPLFLLRPECSLSRVSPADCHVIAAFDFANLSGCTKLIKESTHKLGKCLILLLTDVQGLVIILLVNQIVLLFNSLCK